MIYSSEGLFPASVGDLPTIIPHIPQPLANILYAHCLFSCATLDKGRQQQADA